MKHRKASVDLADATVPTGTSLPLSGGKQTFDLNVRLYEALAVKVVLICVA